MSGCAVCVGRAYWPPSGGPPVCRVNHTPELPLQGTRRGVGSEGQSGDWEGAAGWGAERASGGQGSTGWARAWRSVGGQLRFGALHLPAPGKQRRVSVPRGPPGGARARVSPPRPPRAPKSIKPSAGEAAGSQGCILGSRLGSLRGKLFSVEIFKFSNIYQSRAKANPVSPIRPPMPPHPFYF